MFCLPVCLLVSPVSLCVHSFTRSRSRWGMLWTLTSSERHNCWIVSYFYQTKSIHRATGKRQTSPLLVEQRRYSRFWVLFPFLVRLLFLNKVPRREKSLSGGREKSGPFDLSLCWFSFLSRLLGFPARRFVNLWRPPVDSPLHESESVYSSILFFFQSWYLLIF